MATEPTQKESLLRYLSGYFGDDPTARPYIEMHLERFLQTLRLLPVAEDGARLLELGAYPYLSLLIRKLFTYEATLNRLLDEDVPTEETRIASSVGGPTETFEFHNFDVEKDRYPFADEHFDLVAGFELIEHLKHDPMFMLVESNRVLRQGGRIFISTPNVTSLRSLHFLVNGFAPFYYPKFTHPIGKSRHYREFSPQELVTMLEAAGFEIEMLQTLDVWRETPEGFDYGEIYAGPETLLAAAGFETDLRGEDTFVIARKTGPVRTRFPASLYDSRSG